MKRTRGDMSPEELGAAILGNIDEELVRRAQTYGRVIDAATGKSLYLPSYLLNMHPYARMTVTARRQRCINCERLIPPRELHFVLDGIRICQDDCKFQNEPPPAPPRPRLTLIQGGRF
jgi:hypothetical protein